MKKRILPLFLTLVLCMGLTVPALAAGTSKTHDCGNNYTITIPNVVKTGYAAYSGSYYVGDDEETGEELYKAYDPSGWEGYVFNDSVGMPVYYVSGDSVTVTVTGNLFENGAWIKLNHDSDGTFSFDAEMADPYEGWQNVHIPVSGTGFAKYTINMEELAKYWNGERNLSSILNATGNTATLSKGVWQAPGIQDFVPCLIVVGGDSAGTGASGQNAPEKLSVKLTSQRLTVNGTERKTEIYNINGSNYFKLRDMAALLSGTGSQFSVGFDSATSTIVVQTGASYTPVGGELATGTDKSATTVKSAQALKINGEAVSLTAYNIGGNNFFGLRDLGKALGFDVDYDSATSTMIVKSR